MQKTKGFTLAELVIVLLVIGTLLAILVPRFYRQATNTVDGARIIANFQYIAQAIGNYASDYGKYPRQLSDLNAQSYQYLPEASINGNTLTLDGLVYTYAPSDSACNGGPSLFVSGVPTSAAGSVGVDTQALLSTLWGPSCQVLSPNAYELEGNSAKVKDFRIQTDYRNANNLLVVNIDCQGNNEICNKVREQLNNMYGGNSCPNPPSNGFLNCDLPI